MLLENKIYILHIIFDNKEYPLCFSSGKNPKFIFDESFGIEIEFNKLEEAFLEITIYSHSLIDDPHKLISLTKGEILNESEKYSSLKIDLLTLAIAPEHHDFALFDLQKSHLQIGRISYCISCKHIENIICKIDKFNFNLYSLINTDLALKLKFFYEGLTKEKETEYTNFLQGNPIQKDNKTLYEFLPEEKDNKLIEQINKETLGRKTVSNVLKRKSTKNSYWEINIIEEDNNNIYIENLQNKKNKKKFQKKKDKSI